MFWHFIIRSWHQLISLHILQYALLSNRAGGKGCYFLGPLYPEQPCGVMSISRQQKLAQGVSSVCPYEVPQILNLSGLNVGKRHGESLGQESIVTLWNLTDLFLSLKGPGQEQHKQLLGSKVSKTSGLLHFRERPQNGTGTQTVQLMVWNQWFSQHWMSRNISTTWEVLCHFCVSQVVDRIPEKLLLCQRVQHQDTKVEVKVT